MNPFALTRELIDIPSLTGEETAVAHFLATQLETLGYKVERQYLNEDRFNLIATTSDKPQIVFSTHMDTVPPFICSSEDAEFIYGRGSCDAKGIIAAQVYAAERLRSEGLNNVGFLFTVDEELSSAGAQIANDHPLARECRF
jgi:acetylornithine deacetylase/succinyl-diaminopimelate desuccinylase-like protein